MREPIFPFLLTASAILLTGCSQTPAKPDSTAAASSQSSTSAQSTASAVSSTVSSAASSAASSSSAQSSSSLSEDDHAASFAQAQTLAQKLSDFYQQEGCQTDEIQLNEESTGMEGTPAASFTATQSEENNPAETAAVQIWIVDDPKADLETLSTQLENGGEMRIMSEWSDDNTDVRVIRNNRSNLNYLLLLDQNNHLLVQIENSAPEILPAGIAVMRDLGYPLNDSFN